MLTAKTTTKRITSPYTWYIIIGFLYVLVKIVFVLLGYLHTGAIFHGMIPCALTVTCGFLALGKRRRSRGKGWHILLSILPILSLILTPVYMYLREKEMWLTNGRLEVLIIYEVLAAIQLVLALTCLRRNQNS